jgi:hypothetical protein
MSRVHSKPNYYYYYYYYCCCCCCSASSSKSLFKLHTSKTSLITPLLSQVTVACCFINYAFINKPKGLPMTPAEPNNYILDKKRYIAVIQIDVTLNFLRQCTMYNVIENLMTISSLSFL